MMTPTRTTNMMIPRVGSASSSSSSEYNRSSSVVFDMWGGGEGGVKERWLGKGVGERTVLRD
jgi:hypothetical protein